MKLRYTLLVAALFLSAATVSSAAPGMSGFSIESVLGYPYPLHLVAGADGRTIAYVLDERGVRNVFVATAPYYAPRKVTDYTADDGQEITNLSISHDGKYVVYVRGGDHDSNWPPSFPPDPTGNPVAPQMQVWSVALTGAAVNQSCSETAIRRRSRRIISASRSSRRISRCLWAPLDGSAKPDKLFFDEGQDSDLEWSPDGSALGVRVDAHRSQLHRNLSQRLDAARIPFAINVARRRAALVARRHAYRFYSHAW